MIAVLLAVALLPLFALLAFSWPNLLFWPQGIVIHHSALGTPEEDRRADAAAIDAIHARRGFGAFFWGRTYHIGYHYVIRRDGTVEKGRPEQCRGAHARGFNDRLGICLLGNFNDAPPTPAQRKALIALCRRLQRRYNIAQGRISGHRDCTHATECPGSRFPWKALRRRLE